MPLAYLPDLRLNYRDEGNPTGPAVVFAHALGLDLTIWDALIPLLPTSLRIIRYDHRGHGGSDVPAALYTMGALVRDAERLLDNLAVRDCTFVGLSMGGLIAQGLAIKRLDLVRALVLSNTAARIGFDAHWQARIAEVRENGLAPGIDDTMQRLFSRRFLATEAAAHWRDVLRAANPTGYIGCAAAIAGTDFYTPTAGLTLPTLAIATSEDAITPPDLVRETADLIRGSQFKVIRGSGHLPCIETPQTYAEALTVFLTSIGHT
ncbi:MAG: 3-oxoadipate enol-lactonase [Paracoccaceae bacterium]